MRRFTRFTHREMMSGMQDFAKFCKQIRARTFSADDAQVELQRIRQAAVTILLRENREDAELLILKRAEDPRDPWSGHLALPGGRADEADKILLHTAVRETLEEVGIELSARENYLGRLKTLAPNNPRLPQIEITPFIAALPPDSPISITLSEEATATTWVSIRQLQLNGKNAVYRMKDENAEYKWAAYPSPLGPVWGITERILTNFLQILPTLDEAE